MKSHSFSQLIVTLGHSVTILLVFINTIYMKSVYKNYDYKKPTMSQNAEIKTNV